MPSLNSAENPRFVETLARRGYRFLVPIKRSGRGIHANSTILACTGASARARPFSFCSACRWLACRSSLNSRRPSRGTPLDQQSGNDPVISARFRRMATISSLRIDGNLLRHWARGKLIYRHSRQLETYCVGWFPDGSHVLATRTASPSDPPSLWSHLGLPAARLAGSSTRPSAARSRRMARRSFLFVATIVTRKSGRRSQMASRRANSGRTRRKYLTPCLVSRRASHRLRRVAFSNWMG